MRGGFPELYQNLRIDAREFHRSHVLTYLERDLRQFLRVANLRDHERFLRAAALRSGGLLNRADLARDIGISGSTAAAWLSALEASHQIVLLEPWFSNRTKALVKQPKLYLRDAGLAAFLCGVHAPADLDESPLAGPLWETLVCAELRRTQANRRGGWDFYLLSRPQPRSRLPLPPRGKLPAGGCEVERASRCARRRGAPPGRRTVAGRQGPGDDGLLPHPQRIPARPR